MLWGCATDNERLDVLTQQLNQLRAQMVRVDKKVEDLNQQLMAHPAAARVAPTEALPQLPVTRLAPPQERVQKRIEQEEPPIELRLIGDGEPAPLRLTRVPPPPPRVDKTQPGDAEYREALKSYQSGQMDIALAKLKEFVSKFSQHNNIDHAYFFLAECEFEKQAFAKAAEHYQQVVTAYRKSSKVPDALLKLAIAQEKQARRDLARQTFNQLVRDYPSTAVADVARVRLSEFDKTGAQ